MHLVEWGLMSVLLLGSHLSQVSVVVVVLLYVLFSILSALVFLFSILGWLLGF